MIGKTLGHYQITEKLGEGGMGVVYKAHDTHLDRFAALKVLPPEKVSDPDRKRRFIQEAKAASALNHPSIITIYDIDKADGIDFIAMEYVAGKTLDELIPRKGMRLSLALKYAVQIADALARAHGASIIHRDLKPSNVMVEEHGLVKVLDFGLAKLTETAGAEAETAATRTGAGTILGTAAYMSPEQAEGKHIDTRSDIFSFGSMLYEMLTGQRAFRGDTRASTIASILREEPKPISQVAEGMPRDAEKIVRRCLRKDPDHRFQAMPDLRVALEELKEESDSGTLGSAVEPERTQRKRWLWSLAAIAVVVAAIIAVIAWHPLGRIEQPGASLMAVPLTTYQGSEWAPSISPDGNQVAFSWNGEKEDNFNIYVKLIGGGPPLPLTTDPAPDLSPAWSPDGRWIAFFREQKDRHELLLIPALGGPERRLAEMPWHVASWLNPYVAWSPDSNWIIFPSTESSEGPPGLFLLSVKTAEKRRLISSPKADLPDGGVALSPDGRQLAFIRSSHNLSGSDLYLLTLSGDLEPTGEPQRLLTNQRYNWRPAWMPDGREIVFAAGTYGMGNRRLWRMPVSGSQRPQPLAVIGADVSCPAISRQSGRLVYCAATWNTNVWRMGLSGLAASGSRTSLIASTREDVNPQYSPDGKRIAFTSDRTGSFEVWVCDQDGANPAQLTSFGVHSASPRWSPDGKYIAFDSNKEGRWQIYVVEAGGGVPRRLTDSSADDDSPLWSRDGKWIYFASNRTGETQLWKMPVEGGNAVQVTRKGGWIAAESPDGKHLYYHPRLFESMSELRKVPVEGGEETKVLGTVYNGAFAVSNQGIFFVARREIDARSSLSFLSFATGAVNEIASFEQPGGMEISVSPDGHSILYTQTDERSADLMLVENFR